MSHRLRFSSANAACATELGAWLVVCAVDIPNVKTSRLPTFRLLIESKHAAGLAVVGFLVALLLSHGNLMGGFGTLALITGRGLVK